MARWQKEEVFEPETGETGYIWTNVRDPRLSVHIHTALGELEDEKGEWHEDAYTFWYIYPAYDDRGLPNSPDIKDSEELALKAADKYLKMSDRELLGMREKTILLPRTAGDMLKAKEQRRGRRRPAEVHVRRHTRRKR